MVWNIFIKREPKNISYSRMFILEPKHLAKFLILAKLIFLAKVISKNLDPFHSSPTHKRNFLSQFFFLKHLPLVSLDLFLWILLRSPISRSFSPLFASIELSSCSISRPSCFSVKPSLGFCQSRIQITNGWYLFPTKPRSDGGKTWLSYPLQFPLSPE